MTDMLGWIRRWWIPLLFIGCQVPFLLQPLGGLHKWRQADTAAVARNLAFESPNPLLPRIDMRGDLSGITGMEFPLYQGVVASGLAVFGDYDVIGKLVSLAAALAAWVSLAALLVRRFAVDRTSAYAALAFSPLLFHYAAKVMPEMTALVLACVAVERTDAWITARRSRHLVLAAGALALAALVRPYVVFAGAPLLLAWLAGLRRPTAIGPQRTLGWDAMLAGAFAALPFLWWYYHWCPHLVRTYGMEYFFNGAPLRQNIATMASLHFWATLVICLGQHVANWIALPVLVVGAWELWCRHRAGALAPQAAWLVLGIPAFALPALLLLIGGHFSPHHYYFLVLIIPAAAVVAVGLHYLRQRWPRILAVALPVLLIASFAQWAYTWRADRTWPAYHGLLTAGGVPDHGLVAIEDTGNFAWQLHPLRARGWIVSRAALYDADTVSRLQAAGLAWVVLTDEAGSYQLHASAAWRAGLPVGRIVVGNIRVFPPLVAAKEP